MVDDIRKWLSSLGLDVYGDAFVENAVDLALLPHLTTGDLTDLGVAKLGHRKRLLLAIEQLRAADPQRSVGANAAPEARLPHAERRQLTVMFVDLVGSTELSGRLDPEDLRDILTGFQNVVAGSVTRFDGQVAKYMGDGVLCYFGWPKAHEDDAERAVRAGLDILRHLHRIEAAGRELIVAGGGAGGGRRR
jgi:class 3 adenylate cyclase